MYKQNITLGIAILALILGGFSLVGGNNQSANLGAAGQGITRFPNSRIAVGTTTNNTGGDIVVDSLGTTTLMLGAQASGFASCLQLENTAGAQTKAYVVGTTWTVASGVCK